MAKLLYAICRANAAPNAQLSVLVGHVAAAWEGAPSVCALPCQLAIAPADLEKGTVSSFGLGGTIASAVIRAAHSQNCARSPDGTAYRRRSFVWLQPLRVHVARRGAHRLPRLCTAAALEPRSQRVVATHPGHLHVQRVRLRRACRERHGAGHGGAQRVSAPPIDGHNAHERSRAAMALLDRGAAAAPRGRPRAPLPESSSPQSSLLEPGKYPDTLSGAHVEISNMRKEMQRLADRVARLEAQLGGA